MQTLRRTISDRVMRSWFVRQTAITAGGSAVAQVVPVLLIGIMVSVNEVHLRPRINEVCQFLLERSVEVEITNEQSMARRYRLDQPTDRREVTVRITENCSRGHPATAPERCEYGV